MSVGDQVSSKRQKPILTNQLINEQPNPPNQQPINQQPNPPNQQAINQQLNLPNQQPINQQPNQTLRKSSKNKKPPKTTGRKSATNERVKIKVRRRVKISRFQLYHLLVTDEQRKKIPKDIPNKYNFFGTVISRGKNKGSWNVKFDVLPVDENVLHNISRVKLTVIADGEEEKPIGEDEHLDEVELKSDTEEDASPKKTKDDDVFCSQDKSALKESTVYTMKRGPGK